MSRPAVIAAAVLAAAVLAGCGAGGPSSPTSHSTLPIVPAFRAKGNPKAGKAIFTSAGCNTCHTLAAAQSSGTVGPNLDQVKPDYRTVTAQVTNGRGQMPSFKKRLTTQQIADVAAFVVDSTGGHAP